MPASNFSTWTTERKIELASLWDQTPQISAAQIATRMGEGLTRNAVLGQVFRMKLPKRTNRNGHFYGPVIQAIKNARIPKHPSHCKTVFKTRERKPRSRIPNPNAKPALINVVSVISGSFISILRRRGRAPEMTKPELRAMYAQAVINTGGHQ